MKAINKCKHHPSILFIDSKLSNPESFSFNKIRNSEMEKDIKLPNIKLDNAKRFNDRRKGNWNCVASTAERLRFYMCNYMLNHPTYHHTNRKHFQGIIIIKGFSCNYRSFFKYMAVGNNFKKS